MTWAEFFTNFTTQPLDTLKEFFATILTNFHEKWWIVIITALAFWLGRVIVFTVIDTVIPRNLNKRVPWWARTKLMTVWRQHLYYETLENRRLQRAHAAVGLTKSIIDPFMMVVAFFTIFGLLGIKMTVATGSILLGGLSLAIGLGMQGVVRDVIGGITVLLTDSYAVGDYIDTQGSASGVVKHIGLRLTTLEASDGTVWYVRHSDVPKIGNMTAMKGMIVTDVMLTWPELTKTVDMTDLRFIEEKLDETLKSLSSTLDQVEDVFKNNSSVDDTGSFQKIVSVLPDLIPAMTNDTLVDMRAIKDSDTLESLSLQTTVNRIPGVVPVFTKIETLGLVNSSLNSITVRIRITLPPKASRSQAMAVLKRSIFETFTFYKISPSFNEVPESELPALNFFGSENKPVLVN